MYFNGTTLGDSVKMRPLVQTNFIALFLKFVYGVDTSCLNGITKEHQKVGLKKIELKIGLKR